MHRLDTDTSGCLLFARTAKARAAFQQAFETRAVEKYYLAVVAGEIAEESGVIDMPLAKKSSAEAGWRMVADQHGLKRQRIGGGLRFAMGPLWSSFVR